MEYEIDHEPLDPVTNNPSLDCDMRVAPKKHSSARAKHYPKRQRALSIPEEEGYSVSWRLS